ncbi:MAG: FAD-binding oxidoreductase [Pseudodesulfovibrio sp.]|uniref:FAD linked oxidase domain protein n=1 Tax=Pseudodesulfovibrio aespoeensis (strain ATCC 700646 / DSM 10631 / Aspo-2) TaxID=643562 RepID=E6VUD5_PSEA9|nr:MULTISPECIES: FAD-binding and (Fe-S)-binding domain-containing protein [Pseudodesulfovibrio]MBU4190957.1 FAD-binding oxidoreductase [Pseudomonadota bacterium]ADU63442.1 FAD linked oxidase domain protein [Pseudodesulfovibrio aespoeensis Aspo-2]MBU4243489.1 FAD-binding oxidoreductase [Pseudomonadota bacterium]MBU4473823.1 FAD-binding oxidoreductase [Pseudomonadota bacterium]MBU4514607.1 FAD-binding oxidoreductase [Pseudomonadota bacterium]
MAQLGPHISISDEQLITRALGVVDMERYQHWPEGVKKLASNLAAELFMVRYNPFIDPELVRTSVERRLNMSKPMLSKGFAKILSTGIELFWESFDADQAFRDTLMERLGAFIPREAIGDAPNCRIESATDATDLRMELPLLVLFPETEEQIRQVVRLANELKFGVIPRGGGTGLTGGAIPAVGRCVILSLARFKRIIDIDPQARTITAQSGVITLDAIKAAAGQGLLFTVDPASKAGSSLGGNISENSGGPFAFEYGTTIDTISSYRMITPDGGLIEVRRKDHPRHKIYTDEVAVFEVFDERGALKDTVSLHGGEIRGAGLGKDVSNKYLGGLPGVQKEGVDGIITQTSFVCYPIPAHSRTLCLEFYGRSMKNAMYVIKDVVGLRDTIRRKGDLVKISALEEFGPKYVQAIEYQAKSMQYEGDPISVLLLQLDSDDRGALDDACRTIVALAQPYDGVDIFTARDEREAELFWEDRHKLSAISKRTSGFKINEDVVIPLEVIPEFSDFLEDLNLIYLAKIYRKTLHKVRDMDGVNYEDPDILEGLSRARAIMGGEVTARDISDQEQDAQCRFLFIKLRDAYPKLDREIKAMWQEMQHKRVIIANHMHAGDGNCHVNLPVNSNDPEMLASAHEAADVVMRKVLTLKGEVSGEHGIGITKIGFLGEEKIKALAEYKKRVDPGNVLNPGKLVRRELPSQPFTFSFNRLIQDLDQTALKDKEALMALLRNIQTCTRCGKCKQVCPMYQPVRGLMYHPRNKNISLGALIEGIYYSQIQSGEPSARLMAQLQDLIDHCTACGKCTAVCPVKIDSAGAALSLRAFLDSKGRSGHPLKQIILKNLARNPSGSLPLVAKALSVGQSIQDKTLGLIPARWLSRMESPALSGRSPGMDFRNLHEALGLDSGPVLKNSQAAWDETVLYFPGCGAALFSRSIGMATVYLLLKAGVNVVLPDRHMCCGYPLLSSGCEEAYKTNRHRNVREFIDLLVKTGKAGLKATTLLTACGTCRESLESYDFSGELVDPLRHLDVVQFLMDRLPVLRQSEPVLYHAACHAEWVDAPKIKAAEIYRAGLAKLTGAEVALSPGCCGESGLGAMTSPAIYNRLRERKQEQLHADLTDDRTRPIVVGCPSCKVGIKRSMLQMKRPNRVMHTVEYLAECLGGRKWRREFKDMMKQIERKGAGN